MMVQGGVLLLVVACSQPSDADARMIVSASSPSACICCRVNHTVGALDHHVAAAAAGKMTLSEDVNLEEFVMAKDELSGADIKAVCTEAGLLALRERRMRVTQADFRKAKEKVLYKKKEGVPEGLYM